MFLLFSFCCISGVWLLLELQAWGAAWSLCSLCPLLSPASSQRGAPGAPLLLALELAACAAVNAGVLPWPSLTYSPCDAPSGGGSSSVSSWQEQLSPELGYCGDPQGAGSLRAILDPIFLLQKCCLQMQQACEGSGLVSSTSLPAWQGPVCGSVCGRGALRFSSAFIFLYPSGHNASNLKSDKIFK